MQAKKQPSAPAGAIPPAVLVRYFEMLAEAVTPMQAARLLEIWELICVEQGWMSLPEVFAKLDAEIAARNRPPPR